MPSLLDGGADFISGSIFIRKMGAPVGLAPGSLVRGHTHNFDHTSIFFTGRWHAKKWLHSQLIEDVEFEAPYYLLIEAHCRHEFKFLGGAERGYAWCVYSHRTPQGEVSIECTGWNPAYV